MTRWRYATVSLILLLNTDSAVAPLSPALPGVIDIIEILLIDPCIYWFADDTDVPWQQWTDLLLIS